MNVTLPKDARRHESPDGIAKCNQCEAPMRRMRFGFFVRLTRQASSLDACSERCRNELTREPDAQWSRDGETWQNANVLPDLNRGVPGIRDGTYSIETVVGKLQLKFSHGCPYRDEVVHAGLWLADPYYRRDERYVYDATTPIPPSWNDIYTAQGMLLSHLRGLFGVRFEVTGLPPFNPYDNPFREARRRKEAALRSEQEARDLASTRPLVGVAWRRDRQSDEMIESRSRRPRHL